MKYYIADTHFNHKNIIQYENRPFKTTEEMDAFMIEQWNKTVNPKDEVFIIGDFCFDNSGVYATRILHKLNGKKFLVKGNHDSFLKNKNFDQTQLTWVKEYAEINDEGTRVILFHYPIASWNAKHYGAIHLYGHIHSHELTDAPDLTNCYNVGVDVNNFKPVTLNEIKQKLKEQGKYWEVKKDGQKTY